MEYFMSFFEIVVLPNGDIALKRDNDIDEPIIRISFSTDVDGLLIGGASLNSETFYKIYNLS